MSRSDRRRLEEDRPGNPCVRCGRRTATGLVFEAQASMLVITLIQLGLSPQQAEGTTRSLAERGYGCPPGLVPEHAMELGVRLCRRCSGDTGFPTDRLDGVDDVLVVEPRR